MEEYKADRLKYEEMNRELYKINNELREKYKFFYVVEIQKSTNWFEEKVFKIKNIHTDNCIIFGIKHASKENIRKLFEIFPFNEKIEIYSYHDRYDDYSEVVTCKHLEDDTYEICFDSYSPNKIVMNQESFFSIFNYIYNFL